MVTGSTKECSLGSGALLALGVITGMQLKREKGRLKKEKSTALTIKELGQQGSTWTTEVSLV